MTFSALLNSLTVAYYYTLSKNKTKWSIARALKWSIIIVQKLTLHKNGVVEFHQLFSGNIRTSLTAPKNHVRRQCKIETH